ncbi:reverse transcriptase domain-containing protein [Tanacetum coccineum]
MSVRLTDRSFQYPVGIAKNMLVKVGKFTFPTDFIILEIEEDRKVPLILGRPFLHTADAVIRVKQKQLNLGVGTEQMIFNIDSAIKLTSLTMYMFKYRIGLSHQKTEYKEKNDKPARNGKAVKDKTNQMPMTEKSKSTNKLTVKNRSRNEEFYWMQSNPSVWAGKAQ